MDSRQVSINVQLDAVSRLAADCETDRAQLLQVQHRIAELTRSRDRELAELQQATAMQLQAEQTRIQSQAERELETLQLDIQSRLESLKETHARSSRSLSTRLQDGVSTLEERRQSELWVLQSVMDEDVDDGPVIQFDREVETFATQKAFLDERLEQLEQQLRQSSELLDHCHASADASLPEPQLTVRRRLELRDAAVRAGDEALAEAEKLQRMQLPQWVKGFRIWGFGLLAFVVLWIPILAAKADLRQFINPELAQPDWKWAAVAALIALSVVVLGSFMVLFTVQNRLRDRFQQLLQHTADSRQARSLWEQKSQQHIDRLAAEADQWRQQMEERRVEQTRKVMSEIDSRVAALKAEVAGKMAEIDRELQRQSQQIHQEKAAAEARVHARSERETESVRKRTAELLATSQSNCERRHQESSDALQKEAERLLSSWKRSVEQLRQISRTSTGVAAATLGWPVSEPEAWKLPETMPACISVGNLRVTAPAPPDVSTSDDATSLRLELPAVLRFPQDTSILVEHDSAGREAALSFLRTQILKLLTVIPAGRVRWTLIDPVGLGQSFSAMMHLADFDELLIHSRIWTDSSQIRGQLQKVTEHMENIFQTYLRSQFETIEEYNVSAGEVAEPYHFVVVAGFPTAFTDESARHLSSILTSGPRCGVHALVAWNPTQGTPPSFDVEDLTNNCIRFEVVSDTIQPVQSFSSAVVFEPFGEPPADDYVKLVREAGEQSRDARRIEVSFNRISPRPDDIWSHSTAEGIDLPIGRAGAARLQYLRLGRGTSQHVLIAGKTGSGKSTFLHILITNLALHYSPDEIQFYLIDFKKGVEFRTYAANRLPHARVVAIESDREFGLSVLERLDEILQERGELFRERGVQDLPSFRHKFPGETMPRLLLLIDEFQEFFVAEDRVSARASLLLDRLVRQGRAFGIHVLLGSQTLGGAYSLARSTMGQIAVRIALQCSDSDAHLILSEDNTAARLLSRPGEAIYNDANGLLQGNHPFQIAWLEEDRREEAIRTMLSGPRNQTMQDYGMIVFEGNVSPTAERCGPLNAYLSSREDATRRSTDALTVWLGEPVAIAAPTRIELRRASGQNLLIVGQDENQIDSILAYTILTSAARPGAEHSEGSARQLTLLHDGRDEESQQRFLDLQTQLHWEAFVLSPADHCAAVVERFYQELVAREEDAGAASKGEQILIVRNIGQFRSLRKDDDDFGLGGFGAAKELTTAGMFSDLLKRGPLVGIHTVVWSDSFSNAIRWLSASLLREFENRVAFRMNQTDSASLVDSPVAASLAPGRAIIYRDQTGTTEKFRTFAWPSAEWLSVVMAPDKPIQDKSAPDKPTPDKPVQDTSTQDTSAQDKPAQDKPAQSNDFDIDSLTIE
ncbi:MAG: FtsK/SpoIIIE domain-containing protein [Fuerstiella sp.]